MIQLYMSRNIRIRSPQLCLLISGRSTEPRLRDLLALPLRTADDTAEVHALELWILVRQYICLHIAECRLRPVLDAIVKGLDNVFFKVLGTRIRGDDRFAISVGEFRIGDSENIHLDTVGQQRNHWMHVLGNSRRSV